MKDNRKIRGIIIVFFVILAAIGVSGCTGGDDDDDDNDNDNDLILAYSIMKYGPAQNDAGHFEASSNSDSAVYSQLVQGLN